MSDPVHLVECPDCAGQGQAFVFINRGPDISAHSQEWVNCAFCSGRGMVPETLIEQRKAGREWFDRERRPGEMLIQMGRRLGMSPAELSAIRQGRKLPPHKEAEHGER